MKIRNLLISVVAIILALNAGLCQRPITIGFEDEIYSEAFGGSRPIFVHLPNKYELSEDSFSVLYLLDAETTFHHTVASATFLSNNNRIPPIIIVGIPNIGNRSIDLTPKASNPYLLVTQSGGSDKMHRFINEELIKYIDSSYRTKPSRILAGHSLAGLFSLQTLINTPDLFESFIAISPSFWWDNQKIVNDFQEFLNQNPQISKRIYLALANESGSMKRGMSRLSEMLNSGESKIEWTAITMEEETHASIPMKGIYSGLAFVFHDWHIHDPVKKFGESGLDGIKEHFLNVNLRYGVERVPSEELLRKLAEHFTKMDNFKESHKIMKFSIEILGQTAGAYEQIGETYLAQGSKGKAVKAFKRSLELNPGNTNLKKKLSSKNINISYRNIKIKQSLLKKYEGTYTLRPKGSIRIYEEIGQLYGISAGFPVLRWIPKTKKLFYVENSDLQLEFTSNKEGQELGVIFTNGTEKSKGIKIKDLVEK